jgi:UDP-N-acetyl-D-glucosamine dehydrogenase
VGILTRFIELSGQVNAFMPYHVLELLETALRRLDKNLRGSRIAVLGLSYKADVSDTRESPSAKVIDEIVKRGGSVRAYDPLAKGIHTESGFFQSLASVESTLEKADAAIVLVDHSVFQGFPDTIFQNLMTRQPIIVDCRNVITTPPPGTVYIGLGKRSSVSSAARNEAV